MYTYKNRIKEIDKLKKEINQYCPLDKIELNKLKEYFRIGLTYTSNALEGNSLTEVETKIVLEEGLTIGGKPMKDHLEAIGHSEAYELIYKLSKKKEIRESDILKIHKLFYHRIDSMHSGRYRKIKIFVSGSRYNFPLPEKVPLLMIKFLKRLSSMKKKHHPVEYAALVHKEFVEIHPFVDGNGRTARLLMNLVLLQAGYGICIIPPIVRVDYISILEKSHFGDEQLFINFISQMVYESHKEYLRLLGKDS